jgi:hypothetical protein
MLYAGLTIYDLKVVQQPVQKAWVALPASAWTGADGKQRWKSFARFTDGAVQQAFTAAVLEAWAESR